MHTLLDNSSPVKHDDKDDKIVYLARMTKQEFDRYLSEVHEVGLRSIDFKIEYLTPPPEIDL